MIEIRSILMAGMSANCYLVRGEGGFVLVDTARPPVLGRIEKTMLEAGCAPGRLRLIVLTHGDFDHTGNAAYLREKYSTLIGMHAGDAPMVEHGDMFAGRKSGSPLLKMAVNRTFGIRRFAPDVLLNDGADLTPYGLAATVLSFPGHSSGSIALLTAEGHLLCGDLLENRSRPRAGSIVDDQAAFNASLARLASLPITTVYPGHGRPFAMTDLQLLT